MTLPAGRKRCLTPAALPAVYRLTSTNTTVKTVTAVNKWIELIDLQLSAIEIAKALILLPIVIPYSAIITCLPNAYIDEGKKVRASI
jgi:hypothetical protein